MSEKSEGMVKRIVPTNALDWQAMTTDTMWGAPSITQQIRIKVQDRANLAGDPKDAWELLSFYTRDFRLANLSSVMGEVEFCQKHVVFSHDLLSSGMSESFATALARAATMLELSQSKGGFLRRRQNTITSENLTGELDKKKKLLFGGRKNE